MTLVDSMVDVRRASREWGVNEEDVLLIALNHCGVRSTAGETRTRVQVRLRSRPQSDVFLILSLQRMMSPFSLEGDVLLLAGEEVADVAATEEDDAVLSYFRKDRSVITLNSNARSQCIGCAFCPNTMEAASDPRLAAADDLSTYFSTLVRANSMADMAGIEKVTVCTGCFHMEPLALEHLRSVRQAMLAHNCDGYLHFLSSVLRSERAIAEMTTDGPFQLSVTVECFEKRAELLKQSKASLTPLGVLDILVAAERAGAVANYTYIAGLDPSASALELLAMYAPLTSAFPLVQVFQPHSAFMDIYVTPEARTLDYFLQMRREFERLFLDTDLRPHPWENYRPLWYFTFADEELMGVRK